METGIDLHESNGMSEYTWTPCLIKTIEGPLFIGCRIFRPDGSFMITSANGADAQIVIDRLNKDGIGQLSITGNSAHERVHPS